MIRPGDRQLTQQIRVDPVGRMPLAGTGGTIDRGDPHALHQRRHLPPPNSVPPRVVTGRAASGSQQTDTADATRQSDASAPVPCQKLASADSTRWTEPGSAPGIVAQLVTRGFDRSSRCAHQARLGERPFSTIMLQGQLADLGVQSLKIRRLRRRF